jgi:predicted nucleotidyltransferase
MVMTTRSPAMILDELRTLRADGALASVCEEHGIGLLVVFGSVLTAGASPGDIDLAVMLDEGRDPIRVTGAIIGWLRTNDVDVLDLRHADVVARYEALAKGELLYERDHGTFDELQIASVLRCADTQWLRDLQLAALAR